MPYRLTLSVLSALCPVRYAYSTPVLLAFCTSLYVCALFPASLKEGSAMNTISSPAVNGDAQEKSLLFVYNADTGLFSVVTDYAHKILSPKTYPCNLCALTYGNMGMNKKWKEFIAALTIPIEFLHRDEFVKLHTVSETQLPAAFVKKGESITMLITSGEINECTSVDALIALVTKKLETVT